MKITDVALYFLISFSCVYCSPSCAGGMRGIYKVFGEQNNPLAVRLEFKCSGSVYIDTKLTTFRSQYELDDNRIIIKNSNNDGFPLPLPLILTKKKNGNLIGPFGFEYTLESKY